MKCCCGCGKIITFPDDRGRPRRYLPGHARRPDAPTSIPPPTCRECGSLAKALVKATNGQIEVASYYCHDHIDSFRVEREKQGFMVEIQLLEVSVSKWKVG